MSAADLSVAMLKKSLEANGLASYDTKEQMFAGILEGGTDNKKSGLSPKGDIPKKKKPTSALKATVDAEEATFMAHDEIDFIEDGKIVRSEFAPHHKFHGVIRFIEDGKVVRAEYAPNHENHGEIHFVHDYTLVRAEYAPHHKRHGEIHFVEDGKAVRTEFAPHHKRHGEIAFIEDGKFVRTEHAPHHECHGEIHFYEDGKVVRTVFAPNHERHGQIHFVEGHETVRLEYAPIHERHGHIKFIKGRKHVRTEFAPNHERHGEIHFYEDGKVVRTVFAPTHQRHGEIHFVEDGKVVRTVFAPTHKRHGQIHFFKNGKHVRTAFTRGKRNGATDSGDTDGIGAIGLWQRACRRVIRHLHQKRHQAWIRAIRELLEDRRQTELNTMDAQRRREVRDRANAAVKTSKDKPFTAAGRSHRESTPKWYDSPDAAVKAKRVVKKAQDEEFERAKQAAERKREQENGARIAKQEEALQIDWAINHGR